MTTVILNSRSVRSDRFGFMKFWIIYNRVLLGCLEVLEMILEGIQAQH